MSQTPYIYMDNNATTPVDPRVLEAMLPTFCEQYGNAASRTHALGWQASSEVEDARQQIADLIAADGKEIVFTSGATESDNLAIKGVADMYADRGNHIITCMTEHKAVLDTCKSLEKSGQCSVTYLKPDEFGHVTAQQVEDAICDETILITIMLANNETGVLQPIAEIGEVAKRRGVLFHTDATQAAGKVPIDVTVMGVDLLSLSAHKMYGPKGVGALYVRRRDPHVRLAIQMHGGGHERNMRSGTLNVPGIVGMGKAAQLALEEQAAEAERLTSLRNRLEKGILSQVPYVKRNGPWIDRLCNTTNLSFAYIEGEGLMGRLRDVAVSSGSACTSASLEPSFVLRSMGLPDGLAHGSIRFSMGRFTTEEEVDRVIGKVVKAVSLLREMSPWYDDALAKGLTDQTEWTTWSIDEEAEHSCDCCDTPFCSRRKDAEQGKQV